MCSRWHGRWLGAFLPGLLLAAVGTADAGELSQDALDAARLHGHVRAMVMLRDPDLGAPSIGNDTQLRRRHVAAAVDRLIGRIAANGHVLRRRFALIPAVAVDADAATLARLRDDPAVIAIDLDLPGAANGVAPDESSVLNNVGPLQGLGLDGRGMKVAVIDSGVNTHHPDLQSQLVGQRCFCASSNGNGGCCPNGHATQSGTGAAEDASGHGTNVAGVIVGQGNIAPRGAVPASQLVVVRVLDAANRFCCSSDVIAAMDWVANNHPDVDAVNLSLGTDALFSGDCDNANANTQAMASALNALIARGAVVTVSTGNDHNATMTEAPACVRNATGVGATWDFSGGAQTFLGCTDTSTAPRKPACFANRSGTTDLYAAGAFVTSTGINGGTSTYGGTSQAAPMVAACAIALSQAAPASTVAQRMDAMRLSPTRITDLVSGRVYPLLDCVDAVHLLETKPAYSDFDGDGRSDIPWRNAATGSDAIWKSANASTPRAVAAVADLAWTIAGLGDFDGDGNFDVLWRNTSTGADAIWKSANSATPQAVTSVTNQAWTVVP